MITVNDNKVFILNTKSSSYVMSLVANNYLVHEGWFSRIDSWSGNCGPSKTDRALLYASTPDLDKRNLSLDMAPIEFSTSGLSDMRYSAIEIDLPDGTTTLDLRYKTHRIYKGKKSIPSLPATYVLNDDEADTIEIDLVDTKYDITVTLFYTVWEKRDVICRHTKVHNGENTEICIKKLMSTSVDFASAEYSMLQLSGAWARERNAYFRHLVPGTQAIESLRGTSSHQQNPFVALVNDGATEDFGEVFGFNFVYSGNFIARADVDFCNNTRFLMGINPYNFGWNLSTGEDFYSPEVVMVYSNKGLGDMSRTFHDLYRERLCRGKYQFKERPIVINNWEATYFDFDSEKLLALANKAKECGIELFVLDDGWFINRKDDKRALGDWIVDEKKLTGGLKKISEDINKVGLKFGLWVEPEMVSPESNLFKEHSDWALQIEGREPGLARTQLVLDLSRQDVQNWIFNTLKGVFSSGLISYVKWDFNRCLADVSSAKLPAKQQKEVLHRYVLGLYSILERITAEFPDILFESCASGGARFDPGMMYYMPQTWTSDNTDAFSRALIQAGTGLVYPSSVMSCHVSAVPNHQTGRITSLKQRACTAMAGTFGYELDLTKLCQQELSEIKEQTDFYKSIRHLVQYGDVYRLISPWNRNVETEKICSWQVVSKDKNKALVTVVWLYAEAFAPKRILRLKGLDEKAFYKDLFTGEIYSAQELMNAGLVITGDSKYQGALQFLFEKQN